MYDKVTKFQIVTIYFTGFSQIWLGKEDEEQEAVNKTETLHTPPPPPPSPPPPDMRWSLTVTMEAGLEEGGGGLGVERVTRLPVTGDSGGRFARHTEQGDGLDRSREHRFPGKGDGLHRARVARLAGTEDDVDRAREARLRGRRDDSGGPCLALSLGGSFIPTDCSTQLSFVCKADGGKKHWSYSFSCI